jgi:hypothetical protein
LDVEFDMIDRQLFGDVVVALLIAIPAAALARPEAPLQNRAAALSAHAEKATAALASAADRQVGLFR